jgi:hypothetical protein
VIPSTSTERRVAEWKVLDVTFTHHQAIALERTLGNAVVPFSPVEDSMKASNHTPVKVFVVILIWRLHCPTILCAEMAKLLKLKMISNPTSNTAAITSTGAP